MTRFAALVLAFLLFFTTSLSGKNIGEPKGFDNKVFHASMAMYASSELAGITSPRFICTVTAYKKVDKGYLIIGAGHCTSANDQLPPDMKYYASENLVSPVTSMGGMAVQQVVSMQLIKAELTDNYDYAIYFLPTDKKLPVIPLGDERDLKVGDKTVNVNFSLSAAKITSPGVIVSQEGSPNLPPGAFLVQEFDSHGASGSAIVSEKTHKIIGIVVAGWDGSTMPTIVEPISLIEAQLEKLQVVYNGKDVRMVSQKLVKIDVR
jgi:hypothetical protein